MSTTTTERPSAKDAALAAAEKIAKATRAEQEALGKAAKSPTVRRTRKPKAEPAKKPAAKDPVTVRKGVEGQVCTGCEKWQPLDAYGRTSKARGDRPMRRCKSCITAENQARREAKAAAKPAEKPAPKAEKPVPKNARRTRTNKSADSSATKPEAQHAERAV